MEKPKFKLIGGLEDNGNMSTYQGWYTSAEVDTYIDKLFKDAVVVYSSWQTYYNGWDRWTTELDNDSHKGLVVGIEKIEYPKDCAHEPIKMVLTPGNGSVTVSYANETTCSKCGKKLKAKWEVANE